MIIVMKKGAPKEAIAGVEAGLKKRGFTIHESMGVNQTILGIVGDTSILDPEEFLVNPDVERPCACRNLLNGPTVCSIPMIASSM